MTTNVDQERGYVPGWLSTLGFWKGEETAGEGGRGDITTTSWAPWPPLRPPRSTVSGHACCSRVAVAGLSASLF